MFTKRLYEDYRAKSIGVEEAYRRFEEYAAEGGDVELPDLCSVEMRLCYDEYCNDEEVCLAWEQSGAKVGTLMQSMVVGGSRPSSMAPALTSEDRKGKKLKPSDLVEMQELMVDELKRATDAVAVVLEGGTGPWRGDLVVQMVNALAHAAVERRYGITAEEMTVASYQHASVLQRSERIVRAMEKQHDILLRLHKLCNPGS